MTVAYYHGTPGSYKTYSMVKDWLLPELGVSLPTGLTGYLFPKPRTGSPSGRHVYTNIRGVESSEFIHVMDNKSIVLALFTAHKGSLFLIDELGQVFDDYDPKKWVCPDTSLQSDENGTIEVIDTLAVLFDKHRHFGYDIIGTAPAHSRVPKFFQNIAEFGYKHKALASLGLTGFYNQGQHLGTDTGSQSAHFLRLSMHRMNAAVFSYYKSTATGDHKESAVSTPFYKHPAVMLGVPLILATFYFTLSNFSFMGQLDENKNAVISTDDPSIPSDGVPAPVKVSDVVVIEANKASAYVDGLLSPNQYFVRTAFHGTKYAFFSFGSCNQSIYLEFEGVGIVRNDLHPDFEYNFTFKNLTFQGEPLPFGMTDCPRSNGSTPSIQDNLFGKEL